MNILPQSYSDLTLNNNIPLRPGMSASVSIRTSRKDGIIKVPLQCITTRKGLSDSLDMADETIQKVFVFNSLDGTVSVRRIETGIQDMSHIEVTSGLDTNSL